MEHGCVVGVSRHYLLKRQAQREVEVLADCTLTVQSERRENPPWGLAGGRPGAVGHNILRRADGTEVELPSKGTWQLNRGDRIRIETPGGGGWGQAVT